MRTIVQATLAVTLLSALGACSPASPEEQAMQSITGEAIGAHVEFLADDLLEGRGTGTRGYELAAKYVATEFRTMGLQPGGDDGGYFQRVTFRKTSVVPGGSYMSIVRDGRERVLEMEAEYFAGPSSIRELSEVQAPVVFAGYGVTAPELGYDDYDGIDASGKIVVTLAGSPPHLDANAAAHHSAGDVRARNAAGHGAVGLVAIWTPQMEGIFPWAALTRFARRGSMLWLDDTGVPQGISPELLGGGMLNMTAAAKLFAGAPVSLDEVLAAAAEGKPGSFDLPGELRLRIQSRWTEVSSPNVVGMLQGSDPTLRDEYVVYTAHVDHEGIGEPENGDSIYNGAVDNASGTAALIEIARAFVRMPNAPRRSVMFVGLAAEEEGLLGAEYFVANPPVPVEAIVANVNMDGNHMIFPVADIIALGSQHSTLGAVVDAAAARVGVEVSPDPWPEQNFFTRSDQYPFVKRGIPAVFFINGFKSSDPNIDGMAEVQRWMATMYHRPWEDADQPMHLESGATYARVSFLTGLRVANDAARPDWNPGDFFGRVFGGRD